MEETLNIINNIKELADISMNPAGTNPDHFQQAQTYLQSLGDNFDIHDEQLCELIKTTDHHSSLYFSVNGLTNRIVKYSEKYSDDYIFRIWTMLSEIARNEDGRYPYFVCQQCLKGTVLILHIKYFTQVLRDDKRGPLFEYFSSTKNRPQAAKYFLYFLDEFLFECRGTWRLPLNLPWDHQKKVQENISEYLLFHFLEFALELTETIVNHEEINDEKNHGTITHCCEFLYQALFFDVDEEDRRIFDDLYFRPPENWGQIMLRLLDVVFALYERVQQIPGLSYQVLEILTRLSYASGDAFKGTNRKSKYVIAFTKKTCTILQSNQMIKENVFQKLALLRALTVAMVRDTSFDSSISTFAKHVAEALNNIGPMIVQEILTDNGFQRRRLTKMFSKSMRNIFECLSDDEEGSNYFYPVVSNVFMLLLNFNNSLDQSDEKRKDYKLLIAAITDVAIYRFDDYYKSLIQGMMDRFKELNNPQSLMSLQWFFFAISEILDRSYSVNDDYELLQKIINKQHETLAANTSEAYIEAYNSATNGSLVDISQLDFIGASNTLLLWWLSLAQDTMQHNNPEIKTDNANALAASFWAIKYSIQATYDPEGKCSAFYDDEPPPPMPSSNNDLSRKIETYIIKFRHPFCGKFIKYLLEKLFFFIAHYREFPHLVEEALEVVDIMVNCGYFINYMHIFMEYISMDMTAFPNRRKLFAIAAKAAADSVDCTPEQFCAAALSPYSERFQMLSQTVNEENMIMIIEIFTGFADVLIEYPLHLYGNIISGLFIELSKIYPIYQSSPQTVEKLLEFFTVAVPRIIFHNISIGGEAVNNTAETIIGFMRVYCQYNLDRWNALDNNSQTNQGYDDLVLLMEIVKNALSRLAVSSYDEDDETNINLIKRLGQLCLNTFVPLCTPCRAAVPDVLNAFSDMLHAVAEYDISSVLAHVTTHDHPLFRIIFEALNNNQQNTTIARALSTLNFVLERYKIIYGIDTWRDFAHILVDRIFTIVINDVTDCDLHRLSKESLFYMICADKKFFGYYAQNIVNNQPENSKTAVMEAFNELCSFELSNRVTAARQKFDDNVKSFLKNIAGTMRFNPGTIDMVTLSNAYTLQEQHIS